MSCFVAFHYRSYGTFFLHKKGSIRSIGDLPTTNIIEPIFPASFYGEIVQNLAMIGFFEKYGIIVVI